MAIALEPRSGSAWNDAITWAGMRPGQRDAVRVVMSRLEAREPYTSVVLPTRYGKTDVMRVVTIAGVASELIAGSLLLSPFATLRDQSVGERDWLSAVNRYGLRTLIPGNQLRMTTLTEMPESFPHGRVTFFPDGEWLTSATMQLVQQRVDTFCLWANSLLHSTGKPLLVLIDECHMGATDLPWGRTVEQLVEAGAVACLVTGTAIRSDGRRIPGFHLETVQVDPVTVTKHSAGSRPELIRIDIHKGERQTLRLIADHETTFAQAWDEIPSPLCKISYAPFDVELAHGEENELLSALAESDVRKVLGQVVRRQKTIRTGAMHLVRWLLAYRHGTPDAAAIVFCQPDEGDSDNKTNAHLNSVRKAILDIDPNLNVVIATSADGQGQQILERFKAGDGDVLVVKMMASVGLDIPRLKVALDLAAIRQYAAYVQRLMRIATPYGICKHAIYIAPAENIGEALFQRVVSENGGASATLTELELVRSFEVERNSEDDTSDTYAVIDTRDASARDNYLGTADVDQLPKVRDFIDLFPQILLVSTVPQLAEALVGVEFRRLVNTTPVVVQNTSKTKSDLNNDANELHREIVTARMGSHPYDQQLWMELSVDTWNRAKSRAGIRSERSTKSLDIGERQALVAALEQLAREV